MNQSTDNQSKGFIAESIHEQEKQDLQEHLKLDINNFLFLCLPETATLGEMDRLACKVYDLIMKSWE